MTEPTKPCVGIALGSGAAKGFAHIGVLSALDEMGVRPQIVAGSSMGAFVGSAYAAGCLDKMEEWVKTLDNWRVFSLLDINWTLSGGLLGGKKPFQAFFENFAYENIEDLPLPFTAVATDLHSGQEVWLQKGNLSDAVSASCSIPGLLSPKQLAGRWLVDGAVVNPVPIDVCRAMGATCVIAVDVTEDVASPLEHQQSEVTKLASDGEGGEKSQAVERSLEALEKPELGASGVRSLEKLLTQGREQLSQFGDRFTRGTPYAPGMLDTMSTSMEILERRHKRSRLIGSPPDIMVIPKVGAIGSMDFSRAAEAVAAGRAEVERVRTWIEDTVPTS